jgi:hypothetical protein
MQLDSIRRQEIRARAIRMAGFLALGTSTWIIVIGLANDAHSQSALYEVCHGERKEVCQRYQIDVWEECSDRNGVGGADPNISCQKLCGKPLGESSCLVTRRPNAAAEPDGHCGYSWYEVHCY